MLTTSPNLGSSPPNTHPNAATIVAPPTMAATPKVSDGGKEFRKPGVLVNTKREASFLASIAADENTTTAAVPAGFTAPPPSTKSERRKERKAQRQNQSNRDTRAPSVSLSHTTLSVGSPTSLEHSANQFPPVMSVNDVGGAAAAFLGILSPTTDGSAVDDSHQHFSLSGKRAPGTMLCVEDAFGDDSNDTTLNTLPSPRSGNRSDAKSPTGHRHHSTTGGRRNNPNSGGGGSGRSGKQSFSAFLPHSREVSFLSSLQDPENDQQGGSSSGRKLKALTAEQIAKLAFLPEYQNQSARKAAMSASLVEELREKGGQFDKPDLVGSGRKAHRHIGSQGVPYLIQREGDCIRMHIKNGRNGGSSLFVSTLLTDFGKAKANQDVYDALVDDPPEAIAIQEDDDRNNGGANDQHESNRLTKAKSAFRLVTATKNQRGNSGGNNNTVAPDENRDHVEEDYYCHLLRPHDTAEEEADRRRNDPFYSDPFYLDNPDIKGERRRKIMATPGYRCSIVPFVDSKLIDKDVDEQFYLRHPQLQMRELKLTSIRKIKSNLLLLAIEENSPLEIGTIAFAIGYFERLILKLLVTPENRKLVACVCTVLAVKFAETGISSKISMDKKLNYAFTRLTELFGVSKNRMLKAEFRVFAGLEFELLLPQEGLVMAQVARLLSEVNLTPTEYFRVKLKSELVEEQEASASDDDD